jgi:ribosome biogenesis GTPase / thiamine phosphate phosphatase
LCNNKSATKKHYSNKHSLQDSNGKAEVSWQDYSSDDSSESAVISEIQFGKIEGYFDNTFIELRLARSLPQGLYKQISIGDRVDIILEDSKYWITYRHPRKSQISRLRGDNSRRNKEAKQEHVLAANVDIAVIVATAAEPTFSPHLVDRYLLISEYGGVRPVICLNKADLITERNPILSWYRDELGLRVIETSTITGLGIPELKEAIQGMTAVVIGKSGVGKSSITNILRPDGHIKTQTVNTKSGEGRHTTTGSNLYEWDTDSFIIDTPGIRSLDLNYLKKDELQNYFPEFEGYLGLCKFSDCLHISEPQCAIRNAVSNGEIATERYESYTRILEDLK